MLAYAYFSRPFILEKNASHLGLGAVLSQETEVGVRPAAYASRGLRPTERNMSNYSSMKLEFLALKWAMVEKFREYLLGHQCVVYTDNDPLSYLQSAKLGAVEHCWASQLASFDFTIKYQSGTSNRNADALSCQSVAGISMLQQVLSGTRVPEALQSVPAKGMVSVSQSILAVLPSHTPLDLRTLQGVDPIVKGILGCWKKRIHPSPEEK